MSLFRLRRSGQFQALLAPKNKCGRERRINGQLVNAREQFNYSVVVECDTLDGQGFIVDQFDVARFVETFFAEALYEASCEQLACTIVEKVRDMMGGRATKVMVEVSPIEAAGATCEWTPGKVLPQSMIASTVSTDRNVLASVVDFTQGEPVPAQIVPQHRSVSVGDRVRVVSTDGGLLSGDVFTVVWAGRTRFNQDRVGLAQRAGQRARSFTDANNVVLA